MTTGTSRTRRARVRRKNYRIDVARLERSRRILGTRTETETIQRALKQCAPLGQGRWWSLYVLLVPEGFAYGIFRTEPFPLVAELRARGLDVLDLGPTFGRTVLELGNARMYVAQGHYTPEGNRLLAAALEEQLRPWIAGAGR